MLLYRINDDYWKLFSYQYFLHLLEKLLQVKFPRMLFRGLHYESLKFITDSCLFFVDSDSSLRVLIGSGAHLLIFLMPLIK